MCNFKHHIEKRKRNRNDSPDQILRNTKQTKLAEYWLNPPVSRGNTLSALSENNAEEDDSRGYP